MAPFLAATTFNSSPSLSPSSSTRAFGNRTARLLPHLETCIAVSMISYNNLCIVLWISWPFKRHPVHFVKRFAWIMGTCLRSTRQFDHRRCAPQVIGRGLTKERLRQEFESCLV